MRHIGRRGEQVVVLVQFLGVIVQSGQRNGFGWHGDRLLHQHHRFGLHPQTAMLGGDVKTVHPIPRRIDVGGSPRVRVGGQTERQAALAVVLPRTQPDLVIAFGNRTVIREFRDVHQPVSVHATTA